MPLLSKVDHPESDDILTAFLEYVSDCGLELYPHQEEAILEIFGGRNVILNTPTGSGKSLVALALQFQSWCRNRRSYYTVPVKALANEKFLSLCKTFGADSVGLITGDATVNPDAPIICCTAEILCQLALREGSHSEVDDLIVDEFHFYSDRDRGISWQVPLLTLSETRFLLMSATLGDASFFETEVEKLTGVKTVLVESDERPVPLEFSYSEIKLEEQVGGLVEGGKAPVYLVNFTQRSCARIAQNLLSTNVCTREEKRQIDAELQEARFNSPYGKEIKKLLRHGIGIHHAGLLPMYRVLVEKLTQRGLLKVICGTDTLGVGVNIPIRAVVFTQLCKYDGNKTGILSVRDFQQISGRAGRRGFDEEGFVVAQAPEHEIENLKLRAKAATKGKKVVLKKPPPRGFVGWNEETFQRLQASHPEKLTSSFRLQPGILLQVLSRQHEDGCEALKQLISSCHESETRKTALRKRGMQIFRSLVEGNVLSMIPPGERTDHRKVTINVDLQFDFSLNQALGLWLMDTIPRLDENQPDHVFNVISLVEAILEDPGAILRQQVDRIKGELMARMKAEGVPYDDRIDRLEEVDYPKPGADFIYARFNEFVSQYPWIERESIRPKSIAREMFERYQSFEDHIKRYHLERSEGILLRYLSEVYKVLSQTVPDGLKTDELWEAEMFFRESLRRVDSSLLDEWEQLRDPATVSLEPEVSSEIGNSRRDKEHFERQAGILVMELVKCFGKCDLRGIRERIANPDDWTMEHLDSLHEEYMSEHDFVRLDPEARSKDFCRIEKVSRDAWTVTRTLVDPDEQNDWSLRVEIDLPASGQAGEVIARLRELASH